MGWCTLIDIRHDCVGEIQRDPRDFAQAIATALSSGDRSEHMTHWLRRYGVTLIDTRTMSEEDVRPACQRCKGSGFIFRDGCPTDCDECAGDGVAFPKKWRERGATIAASVERDWQPTSKNINALPDPIRRFIYELETDADPAGTIRAKCIFEGQVKQLAAQLAEAQAATRRECAAILFADAAQEKAKAERWPVGSDSYRERMAWAQHFEALGHRMADVNRRLPATPAAPAPDPAVQEATPVVSDCPFCGANNPWRDGHLPTCRRWA